MLQLQFDGGHPYVFDMLDVGEEAGGRTVVVHRIAKIVALFFKNLMELSLFKMNEATALCFTKRFGFCTV